MFLKLNINNSFNNFKNVFNCAPEALYIYCFNMDGKVRNVSKLFKNSKTWSSNMETIKLVNDQTCERWNGETMKRGNDETSEWSNMWQKKHINGQPYEQSNMWNNYMEQKEEKQNGKNNISTDCLRTCVQTQFNINIYSTKFTYPIHGTISVTHLHS